MRVRQRAPDGWSPLRVGSGPPQLDEAELDRPSRCPGGRVVRLDPGVDLFGAAVATELVERVVGAMRATPQHAYLLTTVRAKRLLALGNEGLPLPPNLWPGVVVSTDADVWRAEDLLRCNTAHPWVLVAPIAGSLPSLPVAMLSWLVADADASADPAWAEDLGARAAAGGIPFWYGGRPDLPGSLPEVPALDGRVWAGMPAELRRRLLRPAP